MAVITEVPLFSRWITVHNEKAGEKIVNLGSIRSGARAPRFFPLEKFPHRDESDRGKVLLLGFDGFSWEKANALIAQKKLPNFEKLKKEGAFGKLNTMVPTYSPLLWTSVVTGKTPQNHGIDDYVIIKCPFLKLDKRLRIPSQVAFLKFLMRSFSQEVEIPIGSAQRKVKALWNVASEAGLTTAVFNWWASWPPEKINGYVVTDHAFFHYIPDKLTPEYLNMLLNGTYTMPTDFIREIIQFYTPIQSATPELVSEFVHLSDKDRVNFPKLLQPQENSHIFTPVWYIAGAVLRDNFYGNSALYMMRKYGQPDLTMVYFKAPDTISHHAWAYSVPEARDRFSPELVEKYKDCVDEAYIFSDKWLGKFIEAVEPGTTIIVMSDHGFGPDKKSPMGYAHYLPYPGVLFVKGPYVKKNLEIQNANIQDVAVNVLMLLGFPVAQDMVGKTWREIMSETWLERHPLRKIKTYEAGMALGISGTSNEDKEMINRLKALGYLQ